LSLLPREGLRLEGNVSLVASNGATPFCQLDILPLG
jgi:hypothetical protein